MHPAIDAAIFAACAMGTVQEVAWMAVGPSAADAARMVRSLDVAVSVHLTYASEWDRAKWSSITGRLDGADGALPSSPADLRAVPPDLLIAEGVAQIARGRSLGLALDSFNFHIDAPAPGLAADIALAAGLPCRDIGMGLRPQPSWFNSFLDLSSRPDETKLQALLAFIAKRGDGRHCVVAHPGQDRARLEQLCSPAMGSRYSWAVDFRLSDADVLTDPDNAAAVRDALARSGSRRA
ncbi:ChbG/HpnK family deacetylase [Bradyrhizobium sp. HKCCYLS3013]|uniref:ChbG/HpnK family deacetylase n=1 Tax=Bradyrhizobium sp. HKCCYLS3013 TaxID=3420735 RepID=UPI003EBA7A32